MQFALDSAELEFAFAQAIDVPENALLSEHPPQQPTTPISECWF